MTITFADGTRIEVPASALNDFIQYDLKWVEFVHGSVEKQFPSSSLHIPAASEKQNVHRCPSGPC